MPELARDGAGVERFVAGLAARLRGRGVRLGVGELLAAHRALGVVDAGDPAQARRALRAVLCHSRGDAAAFDEEWERIHLHAEPVPALPRAELPVPVPADVPAGTLDPQAETEAAARPVPAAWSAVELLRDRDLATLTGAETAAVERALRRLVASGPWRRSRRTRGAARGRRLDLPATLRAHVRSGGLEHRYRAPVRVQRPLVLIADVSGSMAPYTRLLLTALQGTVRGRPHVQAFAFGTRLTPLTGALRRGDVDGALARAEDRAGGTRIGAALATLNREHGRRLGRGAVVVVLSDGWDRGDPALLAAEMGRLQRCAHRVVWVNPVSARPGFVPLTRGLLAALPHTDVVTSGHSLAALEDLITVLEEMR